MMIKKNIVVAINVKYIKSEMSKEKSNKKKKKKKKVLFMLFQSGYVPY